MQSVKQVIDDYYVHLKNRDLDQLHELLSDSIVITYHSQENQLPWSGKFHGKNGFDKFFSILKDHLNVIEVRVVTSTTGQNRVINQCEGTWEYKATGHRVNCSMVNVFTVENGKISGYDVYADTAAFVAGLQQ